MSIYVNLYRTVLQNINTKCLTQCFVNQYQRASSLYTPASLGIDKYIDARQKISDNLSGFTEDFRAKMSEIIKANSNNMIFTEDLKNMIHITSKDDLDLLKDMTFKFQKQNKDLRFGTFVFGPVFMRMYYHLDAPNEALQIFEGSANSGFFDQLMSYQILLDLLFKHQKYNEMYKVFEYILTKQIGMTKYPKHTVILIMGACYKQNTKESFEYACNLWKDLLQVGHVPMRKAVTFLAALALNQGAPHVSYEVISSVNNQHYVTVRNVKVAALSDLDKPDSALPILRAVLNIDAPTTIKNTFTEEVIKKAQASVDRANNKDLKREFNQIMKALQDQNLIDSVSTLDSLLCSQIQPNLNAANQKYSSLHASYQNNRRFTQRAPQRPGLSQL